jgi:hypothetical protein
MVGFHQISDNGALWHHHSCGFSETACLLLAGAVILSVGLISSLAIRSVVWCGVVRCEAGVAGAAAGWYPVLASQIA